MIVRQSLLDLYAVHVPRQKQQVKQVYNDQPLGILALGKIGGGYGSLVSVVSRVCPWLVT